MDKGLMARALLTITVILICCSVLIAKPINKGLDIQGGTHVLIEPDLNNIPVSERSDVIEQTLEVLRNRIDEIGVAGTIVQRQGDNHIVVQIPGINTEESERIKNILHRQAKLEFRLVVDEPDNSVHTN